nr:sigma factor [uncultured Oscillibacter sp.]
MKYDFTLTPAQQTLVEQNMKLNKRTISSSIGTNEGVCGLGFNDLYQEGAIALCRAAAAYDGVSAKFTAYASTLIRNHLLDCCRAANARQKHLCSVPVGSAIDDDENLSSFLESTPDYQTARQMDQIEMASLLAYYKKEYSGVTRLGIEALELKARDSAERTLPRSIRPDPIMLGRGFLGQGRS